MMSRRAALVVLRSKAARHQLMHTSNHLHVCLALGSEVGFGYIDASHNLHMTVICCKMSRRKAAFALCSKAARHQLMQTSKRLCMFWMRASKLEFGFIDVDAHRTSTWSVIAAR